MRMTEFIHYVTRSNLALSKNPKDHEYTHLTLNNRIKRIRYVYQMERRKDERDKKRLAKDS